MVTESGTINRSIMSSHLRSMALYCIVSDIKRHIGQKSRFFHIPRRIAGLSGVKNSDVMFSWFDTIPACDGRTYQTDRLLATA